MENWTSILNDGCCVEIVYMAYKNGALLCPTMTVVSWQKYTLSVSEAVLK